MKEKHIPFEMLSDFCDRLLTEDECKEIKDHLASCKTCSEEYNRLKQTISYLHDFRKVSITQKSTLIKDTISRSKKRNVHKLMKRVVVPVTTAAAVVLFFVTGMIESNHTVESPLLKNSFSFNNKTIKLPKNVIYDEFVDRNSHSSSELVRFLRRNRVKVTKVTGSYIEGEATYNDYYKMKYGINPPTTTRMAGYNKYNSGLRLVGSGNTMNYYQPTARFAPKVKFRIIRK